MATVPLDYQTYSSILDQADIRKTVRKMASRRDALASLVDEEPTPAHVAAYQRYTGRQPRAVVTKVAPARPVRKAEAAVVQQQAPPSPPPSATDTLMAQIATCQAAQPGLTFLEASNEVMKAAPELHTAYVLEHRYQPDARTRPVEKAAPPSVEALIAKAQAQAAAEGTTTAAVLEKLATAYPETHWEAYRRWHGSPEALREHYVHLQAQG